MTSKKYGIILKNEQNFRQLLRQNLSRVYIKCN